MMAHTMAMLAVDMVEAETGAHLYTDNSTQRRLISRRPRPPPQSLQPFIPSTRESINSQAILDAVQVAIADLTLSL